MASRYKYGTKRIQWCNEGFSRNHTKECKGASSTR